MESGRKPTPEILKQAILDLKEPILLHNILQNTNGSYTWQLLQWSLSEFANNFGDAKLPFRIGYNAKSLTPQWEEQCQSKTMTFQEFIKWTESNTDSSLWYYFDYKYMHEWAKDKPDLLNSLDWHRFGFNKDGSDSTLWIGSKGAHTNCHLDSYGCNLVAQIHGRKQWLLFPPSSTNVLHPTRVPYEESTVYSEFNFFCPSKDDEETILMIPEKARSVILEQGDVLFVPAGWWHYVESLDLSVSVNVWLPLESDDQARVKEALVKLIVSKLGKKVCRTSEEIHFPLSYNFKILGAVLENCKEKVKHLHSPDEKKMKHTIWTAEDLVAEYPLYIKLLKELEKSELQNLLKIKRERFLININEIPQDDSHKSTEGLIPSCSTYQLSKNVVNAFCHPEVISKVTEIVLRTYCGKK